MNTKQGLRILHLEDDDADAELTLCELRREGLKCTVQRVETETDFTAALRDPELDLILSDYGLPSFDGLSALALAREQRPEVPFIFVTGTLGEDNAVEALHHGATDYVLKLRLARLGPAVHRATRETAERRALRRAEAERERLLGAIEHATDMIVVTDTGGRIQYVNPSFEVITGYARGEALGKTPRILKSGAQDAAFYRGLWETITSGKPWRGRLVNRKRDGTHYTEEANIAPMRDATGAIVNFVAVKRDITRELSLEAQLLQAQKMESIGRLAGGVAHDFNNLLSVILSYNEFAIAEMREGDSLRADLLEVKSAGERAAALTRQLLAFSRKQVLQPVPLNLNEIAAGLEKMLRRIVGEDIDFVQVLAPDLGVVRADPGQMEQVLMNLVVNARDAMPNGGKLTIDTSNVEIDEEYATRHVAVKPGSYVQLAITDTGCGMDERTRAQIFEPFFTTKELGKGTGLGLSTVYGIVKQSGGNVWVYSEPGRGTTFKIYLPRELSVTATVGRHSSARGASRRPAGSETILVVEDEDALRAVATRALRAAGYTVFAAANGEQALRLCAQHADPMQLLVTDVVMPGMDGRELARELVKTRPTLKVLYMSGYTDNAIVHHGMLDAGTHFLGKPFIGVDLTRKVQEVLADAGAGSNEGGTERPGDAMEGQVHARSLVFVVEDDEAARRALVRLLATAGHAVETAATVAAAKRSLDVEGGCDPLLILCDLGLPDGSGAGLVEELAQKRPELRERVVVLTGGATDEAGRRLVESGAFPVLSKPIEPHALLELLSSRTRQPSGPVAGPSVRPPLARPAASSAVGGGPTSRRERVLVVEDNEAFVAATKRILGDAGFDVVVAGTLREARVSLQDSELDALVADVGLPDGSGLELLRELRGANSELPVVIVTGSPSFESATQALRGRVHEYLPKPFPPHELLRVVRGAVDAGRIARLRTKLLAARFGGNEFVSDMPRTERSFARALTRVRMAFQPIVRSADSSVFGYEALLRCDEPTLSSPPRLLAAAELLGRVNDIGRVVRARVAATMLEHPGCLDAIFVNLHPSELRADLLAEVAEPLLPLARRVVLEVTERASLEGGPKLDEDLRILREHGFRIAVDDLGEGYAGLASLITLRPDVVKIDMSLVRDVHRAPLKRDIIAALVAMARRSPITVLAEGVETVDERATLIDLGCELLQGYLFAKPGPPFPAVQTSWEAPWES
ncbi:MAG: response regulator [Nitrospirae bacterium]|nr:MAG: response regulator [Nitrospirota bacterium]